MNNYSTSIHVQQNFQEKKKHYTYKNIFYDDDIYNSGKRLLINMTHTFLLGLGKCLLI